MNGIWLLILLGRFSMFTGWIELITRRPIQTQKREFVSVDALGGGAYDLKMSTDPRSYEMLSRDKDGMVTPDTVREAPMYPPLRSYLASAESVEELPPQQQQHHQLYQQPSPYSGAHPMGSSSAGASPDPSGRRTPDYFGQAASVRYNPPQRSFSSPRPPTREGPPSRPYSPPTSYQYSQGSGGSFVQQQHPQQQGENVNPLMMNRI